MINYINTAHHIVILTHMAPDGDAMGSALALWHWITNLKSQISNLKSNDTTHVRLTYQIDHPKLWSAEKPNLYTFSIELGDEHFENHFGVKRVECVGEVF